MELYSIKFKNVEYDIWILLLSLILVYDSIRIFSNIKLFLKTRFFIDLLY